MVIGLSQNKKTLNCAEHPISENNISRTTSENLGFFPCSQRVCRRTSAGQEVWGSARWRDLYLFSWFSFIIIKGTTVESFPIHWNEVFHFLTCRAKNLLTFLVLSLSELLYECVLYNYSPWPSLYSPCLLCRWCVIPLAPRQLRNTYHRSILHQWQKFGLSMIWSENGVGGLVWAVMNRTQL